MKAMLLRQLQQMQPDSTPLSYETMRDPVPGEYEVLIRVEACGVCHTELDEIEGRTPPPTLPVIPGHQAVGIVVENGRDATRWAIGQRVGVAWIHAACGYCEYCRSGRENLCSEFKATGRDVHGGYAELMTAGEEFVHLIPDVFSPVQAAPFLCAGAIGYRSLSLTNIKDGQNLGLVGFGASAHLVMKLVLQEYPDVRVFVFARSEEERAFAGELGAYWTGDMDTVPPQQLHCAIDTTPVWRPMIHALNNLVPGGRLVINAIRKEDGDRHVLADIDYPSHLWHEKEIKSVANVTRHDVRAFLELAARVPLTPEVEMFALPQANEALGQLKARKIRGAKVLVMAEH
jgi:propanol-preferring alcohol dehydrogenase